VAEVSLCRVLEAELICWELTRHFCHEQDFPYIFVTVGDRNRKSRKHLKMCEAKLNTACSVLGGMSLLAKGELLLAD